MARAVDGAGWQVEHVRGSAAAFHARDLPVDLVPTAWVFEVDRPALVLGSSQPDTVVDHAAAERAGVEVVRRRSGGGAVLLVPGEALWVDLLIPVADPRWVVDVNRATHWVGERWRAALAAVGADGTRDPDAEAAPVVHTGAMCHNQWSRLVCFAGLGPGEVTAGAGGPKLVGISQRRTRTGARFQCAALGRWSAVEVLALLDLPVEERERAAVATQPCARAVEGPLSTLRDALLES